MADKTALRLNAEQRVYNRVCERLNLYKTKYKQYLRYVCDDSNVLEILPKIKEQEGTFAHSCLYFHAERQSGRYAEQYYYHCLEELLLKKRKEGYTIYVSRLKELFLFPKNNEEDIHIIFTLNTIGEMLYRAMKDHGCRDKFIIRELMTCPDNLSYGNDMIGLDVSDMPLINRYTGAPMEHTKGHVGNIYQERVMACRGHTHPAWKGTLQKGARIHLKQKV